MKKKIVVVLSSVLLVSLILVGTAQAAPLHTVTDNPFGPISIGEYCHAKINSSAWYGLYETSGLNCYKTGSNGQPVKVGTGDPYLACKYLIPNEVVMSASRLSGDGLNCRTIR